MTRTMSPKGQELLDDTPSYYHDDPISRAVQDVNGRELQRVEDTAMEIALRFSFPQYAADDAYGSLAYWERLFELPVAPDGVAEAERKSKVLAAFRTRRASSGLAWIDLISTALGTTLWTHQEGPTPLTIVLTIPPASGTYSAVRVDALARKVTPAHLQLAYVTGEGFVVGYSAIGLAHL